jgi:molybdopterin-guanine dinucleotide biosynthesis protein A
LPDLDADSVRAVIRASEIGASVSVAAHGGRRHLLSCWPAEQLRSVTDAISAGVTSYGGLLDQVGAVEVPVDAGAVRNVNGPDDLG